MGPAEIYQAHLDRVSRAFWDGDLRQVADAMLYPHQMKTTDAVRDVTAPEEMIACARAFHDNLRAMGATAFHRLVDDAAFVGPRRDRIEGTHTAFVLNGGSYVIDPYACRMILVRQEDVWLGAGIEADIRNARMKMLSMGDVSYGGKPA